jgi:hypothetical protein
VSAIYYIKIVAVGELKLKAIEAESLKTGNERLLFPDILQTMIIEGPK